MLTTIPIPNTVTQQFLTNYARMKVFVSKHKQVIQWNLRIMNTLGPATLSFIERLSSLRRLKCISIIAGLHTGFFNGGGTHISAASKGSGGMLPQKIFHILRWTLTKFWGGETQAGGGKSQCAPPSVCNPE